MILFIFWYLREERKKIDIREYENETMSYRETRSYTFDSSRSAEPETVNITTFNLVYMVIKILFILLSYQHNLS